MANKNVLFFQIVSLHSKTLSEFVLLEHNYVRQMNSVKEERMEEYDEKVDLNKSKDQTFPSNIEDFSESDDEQLEIKTEMEFFENSIEPLSEENSQENLMENLTDDVHTTKTVFFDHNYITPPNLDKSKCINKCDKISKMPKSLENPIEEIIKTEDETVLADIKVECEELNQNKIVRQEETEQIKTEIEFFENSIESLSDENLPTSNIQTLPTAVLNIKTECDLEGLTQPEGIITEMYYFGNSLETDENSQMSKIQNFPIYVNTIKREIENDCEERSLLRFEQNEEIKTEMEFFENDLFNQL